MKHSYKEFILQKKRGSYTVEISLIMPIILGIIYILLCLCIYMHDSAVIDYVVISLPAKEANKVDSSYDTCALTDIIDSRTIGKWTNSVSMSEIDHGYIELKLVSKMDFVFGDLNHTCSCYIPIASGVKYIRDNDI